MIDNIEIECDNFLDAVLPNNASAVQIKEMRKAFYAGCTIAIEKIKHISDLDEDNAVVEIEKLYSDILDNMNKLILEDIKDEL